MKACTYYVSWYEQGRQGYLTKYTIRTLAFDPLYAGEAVRSALCLSKETDLFIEVGPLAIHSRKPVETAPEGVVCQQA